MLLKPHKIITKGFRVVFCRVGSSFGQCDGCKFSRCMKCTTIRIATSIRLVDVCFELYNTDTQRHYIYQVENYYAPEEI